MAAPSTPPHQPDKLYRAQRILALKSVRCGLACLSAGASAFALVMLSVSILRFHKSLE